LACGINNAEHLNTKNKEDRFVNTIKVTKEIKYEFNNENSRDGWRRTKPKK